MDKNSTLIKGLLNNEKFVERAEGIAEALEFFETNKSLERFSYMKPIMFAALEMLREYHSRHQATPFPPAFFEHKTENKLKNK